MRRIAILLLVVATALVMAVPAGAKKPPKPDDPPPPAVYYAAEITSAGAGIATDCATPLVLRRNGIHFEWFSDGHDPEDDGPNLSEDMELNLTAPDLAWDGSRPGDDRFPGPVGGCLGAGVIRTTYLDGSHETAVGPGYFRVTLEEDNTVAMLWIFETLEEVKEIAINPKRTKLVPSGRTDFRMGGPYDGDHFAIADSVTVDDGTITITIEGRPFVFVHYDSGAHPGMVRLSNGNDGIQTFSLLTITLTPCSHQSCGTPVG